MSARRVNRSKARQELTAVDVATLLHDSPRFRQIADAAGYTTGVEFDVESLRPAVAERGFYLTEDDARAANAHGHNLRCNVCGTYGATWTAGMERPGWGCLAVCPTDKTALEAEHRRHVSALSDLRRVRFEQPIRPPRRGPEVHW